MCLNASQVFSDSYNDCIYALKNVLRDDYNDLYADLSGSTNPDELQMLKQHFSENKCISHEICSHNDKTSDEAKLKEKLKPYVKGFITAYDTFKDQPGHSNIRDEIDDAIYGTMRNRLINVKGYSDVQADCFIDFIRATGSFDKAYTSDLFFDAEKLDEILQPLLDEYNTNVANRTPEKTEGFLTRTKNNFIKWVKNNVINGW